MFQGTLSAERRHLSPVAFILCSIRVQPTFREQQLHIELSTGTRSTVDILAICKKSARRFRLLGIPAFLLSYSAM